MHIFSSRGENSDWFQNIQANSDEVWIQLGFKTHHVETELVNTKEKKQLIQNYVVKFPRAKKTQFGWNSKRNDPKTDDFNGLLNLLEIV